MVQPTPVEAYVRRDPMVVCQDPLPSPPLHSCFGLSRRLLQHSAHDDQPPQEPVTIASFSAKRHYPKQPVGDPRGESTLRRSEQSVETCRCPGPPGTKRRTYLANSVFSAKYCLSTRRKMWLDLSTGLRHEPAIGTHISPLSAIASGGAI